MHVLFPLKVQTKTVAQCVEFYYTYKKQVKVGRSGILTFGPPDSPGDKHNEAVVDVKVTPLYIYKCSLRFVDFFQDKKIE